MGHLKSSWAALAVNLLIAVTPAIGFSQNLQCLDLFKSRGITEPITDWNDDRSYIEALQRKESLGQVGTFFSEKWDTQIYYTQTGVPDGKGRSPLVDPESKAVFIFFHGSGTKNSGGKNFVSNMNTLANLGYSAVSVDMPFHSEGSRDPKFNDLNYFMEWARSIVLEAKKSGKPVYLAGHSFGPDVILELAARYPKLMDGVLALSPAGFTKELADWYTNHTTKMQFGANVDGNDDGGYWAGTMQSQLQWYRGKRVDPTLVNKNLRIRILSGDREEYVPAPVGGPNLTPIGKNTYDVSVPLKKIFQNVTITIEPGIGHYLFDFTDVHGLNVVTRELLAIAGENPLTIKSILESVKEQNSLLHISGVIGKKYMNDPLFRVWSDAKYGKGKALQVSRNNQDALAAKMIKDFDISQEQREKELHLKILNTKTEHPEFYAKYKNYIDSLNPKKVDRSLFYPYLNLILKAQDNKTAEPNDAGKH